MSDSTPPDLVSVELPYLTWQKLSELLVSYDEENWAADALCTAIDLLPIPVPTQFGATIHAAIPGLGSEYLVLSHPNDDEYKWRTFDGARFRPDQFEILEVISYGVAP